MRTIVQQRQAYGLRLQQVIVCRTSDTRGVGGGDVSDLFFSPEQRNTWLPMYVGCCTYQFRRHIVVLTGEVQGTDVVLVEAALVQSRWAFLLRNWSSQRPYWD